MNKILTQLFIFVLLNVSVAKAIDIHEFDTEQQRLDYQQLTEELRCLVCQNQNIADSDAGLAKDLRNEVAKLIKQGQDYSQITNYMVERYGDFIRYAPPMRFDTIILWVMPFVILLIAAFVVINVIRNSNRHSSGNNNQSQS